MTHNGKKCSEKRYRAIQEHLAKNGPTKPQQAEAMAVLKKITK